MSTSQEIGRRIDDLISEVPLDSSSVDHLCTLVAMLNERINLLEQRFTELEKRIAPSIP